MTQNKILKLIEQYRYEYYESFIDFWLPIYKRQVFKAKFNNDIDELIAIKENIIKNWHLNDLEKKYIIEKLGIKFLK